MERVNGMELICNFLGDCAVLYTVSNLDIPFGACFRKDLEPKSVFNS